MPNARSKMTPARQRWLWEQSPVAYHASQMMAGLDRDRKRVLWDLLNDDERALIRQAMNNSEETKR